MKSKKAWEFYSPHKSIRFLPQLDCGGSRLSRLWDTLCSPPSHQSLISVACIRNLVLQSLPRTHYTPIPNFKVLIFWRLLIKETNIINKIHLWPWLLAPCERLSAESWNTVMTSFTQGSNGSSGLVALMPQCPKQDSPKDLIISLLQIFKAHID